MAGSPISRAAGIFPSFAYFVGERFPSIAQFFKILGSTPAVDKPIQLRLFQISLPLAAGLLMLYQQGQEAQKPKGDPNKWLKEAGEAGLGSVLISQATGSVYAAFTGIRSIYQASKEDNRWDQATTIIRTLTSMVAGIGGYYAGQGWTEALQAMEDKAIKTALDAADGHDLKAFLQSKIVGHGGLSSADLITPIEELEKALLKLNGNGPGAPGLKEQFMQGKVNIKELRAARSAIEEQKGKILEALDRFTRDELRAKLNGSSASNAIKDKMNMLLHNLETSQSLHVQISRFLNPTAGFLLAAGVGGYLATKALMKIMSKMDPGIQTDGPMDMSFENARRTQTYGPRYNNGVFGGVNRQQRPFQGYQVGGARIPTSYTGYNSSGWVL